MDGAVETDYHITNEGLYDMLDVLGIKFDMDLRNELALPLAGDALGSRVNHKYYDMAMYEGIFTDEGMKRVREVFKDLANENNYPIYLHCTYGNDRTGTICYLLEALLGVSRGDCLRDYGLSNLPIENIKVVESWLDSNCPGDNLQEKVEFYLGICGVTLGEINAIKEIFLGE